MARKSFRRGLLAVLFFSMAATCVAADMPGVFVQMGHVGREVSALAFTADGRFAYSGADDMTIKQWDVATGREIRTLREIHGRIYSLAITADGSRLVASEDHAEDPLVVWDLKTGKKIRSFGAPDLTFKSEVVVALTRDGKYAISGAHNKTLILWELATGSKVSEFSGVSAGVSTIAISPDGKYVAAGCRDNVVLESGEHATSRDNTIRVWDIVSGRQVMACNNAAGWVQTLAFTLDGKYLISGDFEDLGRMWDVTTGQQVMTFATGGAASIAMTPDGQQVLFGACCALQLWDIASGAKIRIFNEPAGWVRAVAINRNGSQLLTGSDDNKIKLWNLMPPIEETGSTLQQLKGWLAEKFADETTVPTVDQPLQTFGGYALPVAAAALDGSGNRLLTTPTAGALHLWDLQHGRQLKTIRHTLGVAGATLSPDGKLAAVGGWNFPGGRSEVGVWDLQSGKQISTLPSQAGGPWSRPFAIPADNRTILWSDGIDLILSELAGGHELRRFKDEDGAFAQAMLSGDGSYVLAVNEMGSLCVWDIASGQLLKEFTAVNTGYGYHYSAGVNPDGRTALIASLDYKMSTIDFRAWDFAAQKVTKKISLHYNWQALSADKRLNSINALVPSRDGRFVLLGDFSGRSLHVWDLVAGKERQILIGPESDLTAIGMSSDGKLAYASSHDGTTCLWDIASGKQLGSLISFTNGEWIASTPAGYYEASAHGDSYLNVRIGDSVYSIENYRETFYRPDLVSLALAGEHLGGLRQLAEILKPPSVSIVNAPTTVTTNEATIRLRIVDNGGGIGDVRLYLNGAAVLTDHGRGIALTQKNADNKTRSYPLKLTSGSNHIEIVVFNGDNTMQSNAVALDIQADFTAPDRPNLYAIVAGIGTFKNPNLQLVYPVADAQSFAAALRKTGNGLYRNLTIKELTSPEVTSAENLIRELKQCQSLSPDDVFVFYVASHGTVDNGEYFLITSNVGSTRTEKLKTDALSQTTIKELIANIPATKKLIVLDTCNAGALGKEIQTAVLTRGMSEDTAIKILSRAVGSTILSASTSVQEALEGYQGHGLFTYVLTEGMLGKADSGGSGYIKTTNLADYVDEQVPALAEQVFHRAQYPTISISGQGFPIGKVRP